MSKLVPSSTKPVAVTIPAFPSFILLPTLTKSSNTPLSATMLPVTLPVTPPEKDGRCHNSNKITTTSTFNVTPVPTLISGSSCHTRNNQTIGNGWCTVCHSVCYNVGSDSGHITF